MGAAIWFRLGSMLLCPFVLFRGPSELPSQRIYSVLKGQVDILDGVVNKGVDEDGGGKVQVGDGEENSSYMM